MVARLREQPRITTQALLNELLTSFAVTPAPSIDTFRHVLSGWVYTRFDDIAKTRRAADLYSPRDGRVSTATRIPLLLALLKEAEDTGRYVTEIEPFLREREKALLSRLREQPSPAPEESPGQGVRNRGYQQVFLLLRKFTRWKSGGPFLALKHPRRDLRTMVKTLIEAATARGLTIEQVFEQAKLNPTEREVVTRYALGPRPETGPAVARALGRKSITVMVSLSTAINKLEGREGRYHLKTKYFRMHDEEIAARIRSDGFSSRRDLVRSDRALHEVALVRGILDDIFPIFETESLRKLRVVLAERLGTSTLDSLSRGMTPFLVGVLKHRALAKVPRGLNFFRRAYGIEQMYEIVAAEKRLRKQLRALPYRGQPRDRLRLLLLQLTEDQRALVLSSLDTREAEVVHLRALSDTPVQLSVLGAKWGVSRERARQIEERLCDKIPAFSQGPSYREARKDQRAEQARRSRVGNDGNLQELRTLVAQLSPRDLKKVSENLRATEAVLLERRVQAETPATIAQLAEERGMVEASVRLAENRLLVRIKAHLGIEVVLPPSEEELALGAAATAVDAPRRWRRIRMLVRSLSEEVQQQLLREARETERLLLEHRGLTDTPMKLDAMAEAFDRSVETLVAAERVLLRRLRSFCAIAGKVPSSSGSDSPPAKPPTTHQIPLELGFPSTPLVPKRA